MTPWWPQVFWGQRLCLAMWPLFPVPGHNKTQRKFWFRRTKLSRAKMGLGNMLILSQVTIFVLLFIVSFFIFVPLVVNSAQFNGHCLLFAEGVWTQENSSVHHDYFHVSSWGTSSACDFPILVGVVGIPFSFFYILWLSIYLFRRTEPWVHFLSLHNRQISVTFLHMSFTLGAIVPGHHNMARTHFIAPAWSPRFAPSGEASVSLPLVHLRTTYQDKTRH